MSLPQAASQTRGWFSWLESGTIRGRSCRRQRCLGSGHEFRVPASEGVGQLVVEHACPDLEQEVGASLRPAHLRLLTIRLLTTWLTADSTNAFEIASPAR